MVQICVIILLINNYDSIIKFKMWKANFVENKLRKNASQ